jgi:hypothetical protein
LPELKTIVVRRPLQEVYESITTAGAKHSLKANLTELAELNAMLDLIASQPDVFSINTTDLEAPVMGKWLFEYCLELEFDFDWWYQMSEFNIQVNVDEAVAVKEETDARYLLYKEDVLSRMEEVKNCPSVH